MFNHQIIIKLLSGHVIEGVQERPFSNRNVDIEIFLEKDKQKLIFALDEVCYIRFAEVPSWVTPDEPATFEEVETITGETFNVSVFNKRRFLKGFFALLEEREAPYRTIFFTASGVRSRHETRRIGEILQANGLVTGNNLAEALKTQKKIRNRRMGEVLVADTDITREEIEKTIEDISGKPQIPRDVRIGDILVEAGLVTREQVEKVYESQLAGKKLKVGEILIKQGLITEEQLLAALARKFRLRFLDIENIVPSQEALGALSEGLVIRLQVFPLPPPTRPSETTSVSAPITILTWWSHRPLRSRRRSVNTTTRWRIQSIPSSNR
jgi:hypothetical protein